MQLLTINGSQFRLSTIDELERTKAALSEAALQGGGFVDLRVHDARAVSVFVSPSSAIYVEEEEPPVVAAGVWDAEARHSFWLEEL